MQSCEMRNEVAESWNEISKNMKKDKLKCMNRKVRDEWKAVEEILPIFRMGRDVLGYTKGEKYEVGLQSFHCNWLYQMVNNRKTLLQAGRGHLKTTVRTIIYPIWKLLNNRNLTCLITNESYDKAKSFLREIKGHLEENQLFIKTFGNYYADNKFWKAEQIQVRRSLIAKEPTFAIGSTQGSVVSPHVDLLIGDDLISDKNSWYPLTREAAIRWWRKSLVPVADKKIAEHHMHGTPWHHSDLYQVVSKLKKWSIEIYSAEIDEEGTPLFPEKFSKEKLAIIKEEMGTIFYNCQMLCDPSGLKGATFDVEWIEYFDKIPEGSADYFGIDLAISQRTGADYFVISEIKVDKENYIYLEDFYRRQGLKVPEQLDVLGKLYDAKNPVLVGVEIGGYQAAFSQIAVAGIETKQLPIVEITTANVPKEKRLIGLTPLFERGIIKVNKNMPPERLQQFLKEYIHYPSGTDDILDAIDIAIKTSRIRAISIPADEEIVEPTNDGEFVF